MTFKCIKIHKTNRYPGIQNLQSTRSTKTGHSQNGLKLSLVKQRLFFFCNYATQKKENINHCVKTKQKRQKKKIPKDLLNRFPFLDK